LFTVSIPSYFSDHEDTLLYYPYQVSEWLIEYKPLPFMKQKTVKRNLITNLTKKETSFYDAPLENVERLEQQNQALILPINYSKEDVKDSAIRFLTNHYMHKKKVWSYPDITFTTSYSLYIPYFIGEREVKGKNKRVIIEPETNHVDLLVKYKEIHHYLIEQEVI